MFIEKNSLQAFGRSIPNFICNYVKHWLDYGN
jgi:hypothetical protein